MENLSKAIIAVMNDVKGIEKSMTVGEGRMSYKGVPDKEVKKIIGASMAKNGLAMLPIDVEANTKIERWEEADYSGKIKTKQSVFTEVKTKYLLLHTSGESLQISCYGHGVDSQDKGAGKATTYALKYALLYSFLVPTGDIDDADAMHSQEIETPKPKPMSMNLQSWTDGVNACQTIDQLQALYTEKQSIITSNQEVINLFTARKLALTKN